MEKEISQVIEELQSLLFKIWKEGNYFSKRVVKWTAHKDFAIEFDEDPLLECWRYRVYYRVDRKEIDCCSLTAATDSENLKLLTEFVYMCEVMEE